MRLQEQGVADLLELAKECHLCCKQPTETHKFSSARLMADASIQDKDTDLHDFIKRKAPLFPSLEVEYMEGSRAAVDLEDGAVYGEPDHVLRTEVGGWTSDQIYQFLSERLEQRNTSEEALGVAGAWTAEIQSCSG
jgi:hypothetical protein